MIKRIRRAAVSALFVIAVLLPASVCAQRGEKSVGVLGGYTTANHSGVAGLYFQYRFSEHFRLSPDVEYIFRNNDVDGFVVDMNAHVPFDFAGRRVSLYPLAGINYTTWSRHFPTSEDGIEASERKKRFGLNVGAGVELRVTSSLRIFGEGKYSWVKNFEAGVFNVGIGYVF